MDLFEQLYRKYFQDDDVSKLGHKICNRNVINMVGYSGYFFR